MKIKIVLAALFPMLLSTGCSQQPVAYVPSPSPIFVPSSLVAKDCLDTKEWVKYRKRKGLKTTWEQMLSQSLKTEACWQGKFEALASWDTDAHARVKE